MIRQALEDRLQRALGIVLPEVPSVEVVVRPCPDPRFGDYQTASLMSLAKERKLNPRQLASDVLARLDVAEWCEKVDVAGAGFLNFRLKPRAMFEALLAARAANALCERTVRPQTIVVDFSSPNVAKPMHVGHIRSTILGDCLARVFRLLGHRVVTDNHLGDWGTQFGKLLVGWKERLRENALQSDPIAEMERLYREVNADCERDSAVLEKARQELVRLQGGDPENLEIWRRMQALSQSQFDAVYARLGVTFDHTLGESYYNPKLKVIVEQLVQRGVARESEGAICIFSDGTLPPKEDPFLKQEEGEWRPNPCIIQKSDGAANYATTDLATLQHRIATWQPDEVVYVTDGRQQLHFRQIFAAFRRWYPEVKVRLLHVWFGSILGDDGKPFKTRTGDTIRLVDLLDEAEERALQVVSAKNPELPDDQRREIARVVGIGAVKYADLLPNRQSDYVFSWDKMLALSGNTAPYLQYAYARIRSIFRKAGLGEDSVLSTAVSDAVLGTPEELALARQLLNFGLVLEAVAEECRPNFLCNYLYDLSGMFARFYEACPVLKAPPGEREVRLLLCDLTARTLKQGLQVLGIETLEQM